LYTNLSASCHFQWLKSELVSFRYTGVTEHDQPQQARKRAIGLYNMKTTHYTVYTKLTNPGIGRPIWQFSSLSIKIRF
jgi:hypothetical protein